ncbi:MAG: PepSY domain-containing protein [Tissierellia bacterium]|nr:PepSY domain-containing protein [Tissierellia bacterium]
MKTKMTVLLLGVLLLLTACGKKTDKPIVNEGANQTESVQTNKNQQENQDNSKIIGEADGSTEMYVDPIEMEPEEAFEQFMDLHPNTKVEKFQLDEEDHRLIYKVEGYDDTNEYEVKIDASTKKVIKDESDDLGHKDGTFIAKEDLEKIDDFMEKALQEAGEGYRIQEYEMDFDDGILVIEFDMDKINQQGQKVEDMEIKYAVDSGELLELDR